MRTHFTGKIITGTGKAAFFTQLDWVKSQCAEKLGFVPFPGTLNIEVPAADISVDDLLTGNVISLLPPDPNNCAAQAVPIHLEGTDAAVVIPEKKARVHNHTVFEIIAPVNLREALQKNDGDLVSVTISDKIHGRRDMSPETGGKLTVEAIMFDLDGTLIDSIKIYYRIVQAVLDKLGLPKVPPEQIQQANQNGTFLWEKLFPAAIFGEHPQLKDEAWVIARQISPSLFKDQVKLLPGTTEVLHQAAEKGFKLAVVTSTPRQNMQAKLKPLEEAGVLPLLQEIITADDTLRKKPAAEPLLECSKRLATEVEECVYIGDTQIDIRAGKAAKTRTIGVLTGFDNHTMLEKEDPDAIIGNLFNLPEIISM